jgi:hypothetical protein
MPLCDLYIISLKSFSDIPRFLQTIRESSITPIIQAKVLRWIVLPSQLSTDPLLASNIHWDLVLLLPRQTTFPSASQSQIAGLWTVTAGIPSSRLTDWPEKNARLLNPPIGSIKPPDTSNQAEAASTSQSLELSPELASWVSRLASRQKHHAVSMLNLLAFNPGKKEQYAKYGAAFASTVGARHGGDAKIVGNVVSGQGKDEGWHEIAVAHYPSLEHFCAMIGSKDYQDVNAQHRLRSLMDTCILCTMEVGDDGELVGGRDEAKL